MDIKFFRRMRNAPAYVGASGKISSALFKDSNGVSVNADDGRNIDDIIAHEESLHTFYVNQANQNENEAYKLKAIVSVNKVSCDECNVIALPDPVTENPYHTLLIRETNRYQLSSSQAKKLAESAIFVKKY